MLLQLITVKLSAFGRGAVSLLVNVEIEKLPASPNQVGIDLGITSLLALSTGEKIVNPKGFKAKYRNLDGHKKL